MVGLAVLTEIDRARVLDEALERLREVGLDAQPNLGDTDALAIRRIEGDVVDRPGGSKCG